MLSYFPQNSYVLGFLFLNGKREVVMIRKNKPEWQAGKLNGVGGKIERTDESPLAAMQREWKEETGEKRDTWEQFLTLNFKAAKVHCFRAFDLQSSATTATDEMIVRAQVGTLNCQRVDCIFGSITEYIAPLANIRWIIPFALSGETGAIIQ